MEIRITADRAPVLSDLREIWEYRELLYFFVWRDVKVRYKQTILGLAWAVLQPCLTVIVFSLFFGRLAGVPSNGFPYPIFALAALVPWTAFAGGLTHAANSLVTHQSLLTKIYFPRILIPAAAVLSSLTDFGVALAGFILVMPVFGIMPSGRIVFVVPLTVMVVITAMGAGFWLSALNVRFRDIQHILPFVMQIWLFATPVAYPGNLLNEPWRTVYGLNPLVGAIEGFRWCLLKDNTSFSSMPVSALTAIILFASGFLFFRSEEATFADLV